MVPESYQELDMGEYLSSEDQNSKGEDTPVSFQQQEAAVTIILQDCIPSPNQYFLYWLSHWGFFLCFMRWDLLR